MVASPLFSVFPLILLFGGGFSLPLGLPPLPEDPAISRMAPEECLAYVSWAGTAAPNAKSTNQTEQLLAEPEVQELLSALDRAVAAGIKKDAQRASGDVRRSTFVVAANDVYSLAKTLLTRPAAVFVSKVEIGFQGPNVQGGAIFSVAEKSAAVGESIAGLEKLLPPGMVEKVDIAGAPFHRIKAGPIPVTWGLRDKYLIVGFGASGTEGILKRANAQPPAWLAAIRKQLPVDRQSTLMYFNVKQAVAQFAPLGGPMVKPVLDAVGLDNVTYLASVTGLDGKGTVARTLVAIDGQPQGIFRLAAAKPLTAADLAPIPRDATIAAAGRFEANAALELLLSQLAKIDPHAQTGVAQPIREMEMELGIDLKQDLLKPLGDVWCVYNSPAEGGLLVTGLTGVVQVKDHDRLQATLDKLVKLFHGSVERRMSPEEEEEAVARFRPRTPRIVETSFAGKVICHFVDPYNEFPLAPAWCLTEKELIVSTFPANIKSYLARGKDFQSLAAVPEVAEALEQGDAVALSYCDTRKVAELVYPLLCIGGKFLCSELSREGIPLDASLVPSAAAIFPHLQPSIGVLRRTSAGVEVVKRGPLAGIGGGPMLPLSFFWLAARGEMRPVPMKPMSTRATSMNNLKQIALAMLMNTQAHGTFPPAFTADKATGKPLLSWRVAMLPYLDGDSLYKEFHLDEPWDSEHNKKLIARMPSVYRSPGSAGKPGTTRYLTLRHTDSAFPGKEAVTPAQITHGMSNTILVVEADEAHAVVWTKPDDLEFDPKKPGTGLTGQPMRGFNAAFCDGSVRFIQDSIDTEFLQDMANRNGEKPAATR